MADPLNFVAISGAYVLVGISADPETHIAGLAQGLPEPIELVAAWWLPPPDRVKALDAMRKALRSSHHRGDWYRSTASRAAGILAKAASKLGGQPFDAPPVKDRPHPLHRPVVTPHGRFPSVNAAAVATGVSRQTIWGKAKRGVSGWYFEDDPLT